MSVRKLPLQFVLLIALFGAALLTAPTSFDFSSPSPVLAAPPIGGDVAPGEVPDHVDVPVRAYLSHEAMSPGEFGHLAVVYDVPEGAHVQINDFIYAEAGDGLEVSFGDPILVDVDEFDFDGDVEEVLIGETIVYFPISLAPSVADGAGTIQVKVGFQACLEVPVFVCFAPDEAVIDLPVVVARGDAKIADENRDYFASLPGGLGSGGAGGGDEPTDLAGRLENALKEGSAVAYMLVFLGGLATAFTPCVYPMIPITISYIGGSSKSKMGGFFLSLFFVLGIALMYSALGWIAASTGSLFGSAMQSTPVLVVVSLVFFIMGASMLGAFDLAVPSSMQTKLQAGPRSGVIGAIFMGMVTGIVASPCVGPVLVVLLAQVASLGNAFYGFSLLFVFACGLGSLFVVIGTFAGALNALPQAGHWMDTVKHVFGVVLFAMGIYYVRTLIGEDMTWMAAGLLVLVTGAVYGAFQPIAEGASIGQLTRKGLGLAMVVCGSFALLVGLAGWGGINLRGGGMIAAGGGAVVDAHPGPDWVMNDDEAAKAQALAEGKPVVMDFYADWCAACKELDHETWVDAAVMKEAERYVAVKFDFTEDSDWTKEKYSEYGIKGLPTVIFLDSQGNEVERFFGFRGPESVLESMQQVD